MAPGATADRDAALDHLRCQFAAAYDVLLARLAHGLRSQDVAADALHDAYLKLERGSGIGEIRNPIAYLYRMAVNLARNSRRREAIYAPLDAATVDGHPDEAPGPEREALAKLVMDRALAALARLPQQRRDIFLARWRDIRSHADIASQFNLHRRTVQKELARAECFLRAAMQE
jgi:RNA polymerase sigma-70 factor (ECF subfamily)